MFKVYLNDKPATYRNEWFGACEYNSLAEARFYAIACAGKNHDLIPGSWDGHVIKLNSTDTIEIRQELPSAVSVMIANGQFDIPVSVENKKRLEKIKLLLRNIHRFVFDGNHLSALKTSLYLKEICGLVCGLYTGYVVKLAVNSRCLDFSELRIGIPFRESKLLPDYQIAQNPVQALINFKKENPTTNFDSAKYVIIGVICVDSNENIYLPDYTNVLPAIFAEIALNNIQAKTDTV